jgi:hypothetical protein
LVGVADCGDGPDKARAIIDKAIQAQGGEAALAKLGMVRTKGKETAQGEDLVAECEQTVHLPDRLKLFQAMEVSGQKLALTVVLDRDGGWLRQNDQTQDIPPDLLPMLKAELHARRLETLIPLKGKEYQLSTLPEMKVNARAAVGVRVASKGHADVQLYFDKVSGLLVKRAQSLEAPMGGKVLAEVLYSDYRETNKVKVPRKIVQFHDGKKVSEYLVSKVQLLDRIDEDEFKKPLAKPGPKEKGDGKDVGVPIRQDGLAGLEKDLAKRITAAPARVMKKSGLAGAMGGAHVRVTSGDPQEVLLPIPQLADGQVPVCYFIRSSPPDAVTEFRLCTGEEGNVAIRVRLAGKKQDVHIAWSSVVLLATRSITPNQTKPDPYRKATTCVQSGADEITKLAAKTWPKSGKASEFAANIQEHIRGMKRVDRPRSLDALGILKSGDNTICTANANLAAALMRSKGIACRSIAVIPPISQKLEMHRVVEFWEKDGWIAFDPSSLHTDIPAKPWQHIIVSRTTTQDEERAMKLRMGIMLGCPYGQEIELLTSGVHLFGQDMFWTLAKPLAEFEPPEEATRLATKAWTRYLETGTLTPGQLQAGAAKTATTLVELLNKKTKKKE